MRGALALEQPKVVDSARVLHAAVALLSAAAAHEPLLLRVDDVQWLDPSSRQAIAFIARRAADIGIAAIAVWSERGEPFEPWPGVPVLTIGELGRADALALARRAGVAPVVAEALVDAVGGNPLALIEAPAQLSPAERDGRPPLPAALPVGTRLEIAYARRLDALPSATREALLVAALSADGATAPLRAALGDLDVLAPAEDAGMIVVDARGLAFAHPIVRTAVDRAATPSARRAAHRALAAAVDGPQRAWHLAAAAQAPDEALAAELETLGCDAAQRGAPATAATALARAAELSPDRARAIGRTVAAAAMAITAGSPARATALLDPVLADAREPVLRADVQLLRGMAIQQGGSPMAAFALLEAEAERVVAHDRARAAGLLTQAGVALVAHGSMDRLAALAERALALAPPEAELVPAVLHASALATLGEHARARTLLRRRHTALRALDPTGPGHEILAVAALVHLWMEDYEDAERLLVWLIETCRERGAIVALAFPLAVSASLHLRRGSLGEAARLSDEARRARRGRRRQLPALGHADHGGVRRREPRRRRGMRPARRAGARDRAAPGPDLDAGMRRAGARVPRARRRRRRDGRRSTSSARASTRSASARAIRRSCTRTRISSRRTCAPAGPTDAAALTDELAAGAAATGGVWAAAATARCRLLVEGDDAPGRAHRGGARRARAPGAAVRARPHAAVRRRATATRPSACRRPAAAGRRPRDVRRAGRRAMGGARGARATRGGRAARRALAERRGAHRPRAGCLRAGGRRRHQPRGRHRAAHVAPHGGAPPAHGLPQARGPLPHRDDPPPRRGPESDT